MKKIFFFLAITSSVIAYEEKISWTKNDVKKLPTNKKLLDITKIDLDRPFEKDSWYRRQIEIANKFMALSVGCLFQDKALCEEHMKTVLDLRDDRDSKLGTWFLENKEKIELVHQKNTIGSEEYKQTIAELQKSFPLGEPHPVSLAIAGEIKDALQEITQRGQD